MPMCNKHLITFACMLGVNILLIFLCFLSFLRWEIVYFSFILNILVAICASSLNKISSPPHPHQLMKDEQKVVGKKVSHTLFLQTQFVKEFLPLLPRCSPPLPPSSWLYDSSTMRGRQGVSWRGEGVEEEEGEEEDCRVCAQ